MFELGSRLGFLEQRAWIGIELPKRVEALPSSARCAQGLARICLVLTPPEGELMFVAILHSFKT